MPSPPHEAHNSKGNPIFVSPCNKDDAGQASRHGLCQSRLAGAVDAHAGPAVRKDSSIRDNIFVFIDEAHRSVAKDLGTYLMASVPNATRGEEPLLTTILPRKGLVADRTV